MLDKRDNFDEILKKRYDEFHAEVPAWEELFVEGELGAVQKRSLLRNRVIMISAVAALIIMGLFLGITSTDDNVSQIVPIGVVMSGDNDKIPEAIVEQDSGDNLGGLTAKLNNNIIKRSNNAVDSSSKQADTSAEITVVNLPDTVKQRSDSPRKEQKTKPTLNENSVKKGGQSWNEGETRYKKRGKISLLAATSITSSSGSQNMSMASAMNMYEVPMSVNINNYRNSVNFEKEDYNHKFPVNVALVVRYEFLDRLSVSSGLNYSYLESSAENVEKFTYSLTQRVNYLGIPVALNYDFLKLNRFSMYGLVGGMVEFNVGATNEIKSYSNGKLVSTQKDKINIGNALFSVQCGVGAKYDIIDMFGIFIEPGVNYVFNNMSQPITYKTKTPLQFNLRVGLSVDF